MDLGFSPQRFSWFCTCVILSPHTRVELAACLHLSVNQPVVHHNDRSLKERGGGQRQPLIPLITQEAPN